MAKFIFYLIFSILILGCTNSSDNNSSQEIQSSSTLNIPAEFLGTWKGNQLNLMAYVESHHLKLQTKSGYIVSSTGKEVENQPTYYKCILSTGEEISLLKGNGYLGVAIYKNDEWVIRDYYTKQ